MRKKFPSARMIVTLLVIGIVLTLITGLVSRTHFYDPGTKGNLTITENGLPFAFTQTPNPRHIFGDTEFLPTPDYKIEGAIADIIFWSLLAYFGVRLRQKNRT